MNIALLKFSLTPSELKSLSREFPKILFLSFNRQTAHLISKENWQHAEILFSDHVSLEELKDAHLLRWIQTPGSSVRGLCIKEIEKKGTILVTNTEEPNIFQIGEYVIGAVLAFAKNLFEWKEAGKFPLILWDSKWRNQMWTLKDKVFLQIGMGKEGQEIAKRAAFAGMKVYGMDEIRSVHPNCIQNFSLEELHSLLPHVDIVSIAFPQEKALKVKMGHKELQLMKKDSILSIIGSRSIVDETALRDLANGGKFRGIIIDPFYQSPVPIKSPLFGTPRLLLTPEVAPRPKSEVREAYRIFRFNLRQYLHGNFSDMKNLIDPSIIEEEPEN